MTIGDQRQMKKGVLVSVFDFNGFLPLVQRNLNFNASRMKYWCLIHYKIMPGSSWGDLSRDVERCL